MTPIPEMKTPFGTHWQQPSRLAIHVTDDHAIMSRSVFYTLMTYSHSMPTGVYPGKMWKACHGNTWYLRWFDEEDVHPPIPQDYSKRSREIILTPAADHLELVASMAGT